MDMCILFKRTMHTEDSQHITIWGKTVMTQDGKIDQRKQKNPKNNRKQKKGYRWSYEPL